MTSPERHRSKSTRQHLLDDGRFRCERCGRTYSRRDHLARHLQSHASQRPFVCSECGKGFVRADLLRRHATLHSEGYSGGGLPPGARQSFPRKVSRACKPCAEAKAKCHDEKPCQRCLKRGIQCTAASDTAGLVGQKHLNHNQPQTLISAPVTFAPPGPDCGKDDVCNQFNSSPPRTISPFFKNKSCGLVDDMLDIASCTANPLGDIHQPNDALAMSHPNLTPNMDAHLGISLADIFHVDFGSSCGWEDVITTGKIREASEAFRKSVWYSVPERKQRTKGFLGHEATAQSVDDDSEALSREPRLSVPRRFNHLARDDLFATLILLAHDRSPECLRTLRSGFPSPALLNTLVHFFLTKQDKKVDSWIHSASFQPNELNTELTAIIIAASALNSSVPTLRQLGQDLRRLLRPIILTKLENERTAICRLQLHQALLLSLELDLWHDEEDCLHHAGRFSSIIATFLRQEFGHGRPDPKMQPLANDDTSELDEKWSEWITAESYKRLMTRFYVYDNQLSMTLGVKTQTAVSEYLLSAPQPKELWLAKSSTEWKRLYLLRHTEYVPQVMDLFASVSETSIIQGFVDRGLAMKLIFHSLGGLIMEFQLSTQTIQRLGQTHGGWIGPDSTQNRRRELEIAIRSFDYVFGRDIRASNIGPFIVSYLSMTLIVPIGNIEVLAGKAGEHRSQQIYHIMKDWPETTEAREAVWHAGQIFRFFKLLDRLTSFQIIMAYHAGLVLFAFSVLSRTHGRFPKALGEPVLCINDPSYVHLDEFIRNGVVEPMLRSDFRGTERVTVSLLATKEAVEVISEIILNRSCNNEELSPRLVNGLVKLLKDLASAIQIFGEDPFVPGLETELTWDAPGTFRSP